ncbi:MAG TPA: hypothetical protein VGM01_02210 [Ktedonobacteraceae bacterium]|jgi:hypothetical protein
MDYVLASNGLAPWGQAAAIVLALYVFLSIIVGLALAAVLLFGFSWIRQKSELLRQLRQRIVELNKAALAAKSGASLPREVADNKVMSAIVQVPKITNNVAARANSLDQKIDQGSDRVASVVIEFHARTAMVKGMAKAFFLPGLTRARPAAPPVQTVEQQQTQVVQPPIEERPLEREIVITQR